MASSSDEALQSGVVAPPPPPLLRRKSSSERAEESSIWSDDAEAVAHGRWGEAGAAGGAGSGGLLSSESDTSVSESSTDEDPLLAMVNRGGGGFVAAAEKTVTVRQSKSTSRRELKNRQRKREALAGLHREKQAEEAQQRAASKKVEASITLSSAPDSRLLRRLPRVALQRVALFCGGNGTGRLTATCRALRDATRVRAWWLHFLYDEMQWAPGMVKSIRKKGARRKARVEQSWNARALCRQYARCHAHRSRLVMTQNSEYLARRKERMRYARHVQVIRRGIAALARVGTLSRLPDDPQYRLPLHLIADAGVRVEDLYEGVRIEDESDGRGVERINLEGFIVDTVEPPESEADSHSSGESDDDGRSHLDLDGGGLDGNSESDERGDDDRADGAKDDPPSITGPLPEGLRTLLVRVLQRRLAQRFNRMAAARAPYVDCPHDHFRIARPLHESKRRLDGKAARASGTGPVHFRCDDCTARCHMKAPIFRKLNVRQVVELLRITEDRRGVTTGSRVRGSEKRRADRRFLSHLVCDSSTATSRRLRRDLQRCGPAFHRALVARLECRDRVQAYFAESAARGAEAMAAAAAGRGVPKRERRQQMREALDARGGAGGEA